MLTITTYAAVAKGDGKLATKSAWDAGTRLKQNFNAEEIHEGVSWLATLKRISARAIFPLPPNSLTSGKMTCPTRSSQVLPVC